MESFKKSTADCGTKKAMKQLKEYFKNPVPGTKIFIVENRLDTFHINTLIETGEYAGAVIHWKLVISEDYPFKPAKGWILEDFYFNERHHHHCFGDDGICTDYLQNFAYMNEVAQAYSGWTPGCTLTSLMIAMKQFFVDHDHHSSGEFKAEAKIVVEKSKKYKCKECGATAEELFDGNSSSGGAVAETSGVFAGADINGDLINGKQLSPQYQRALCELVCPVLGRSLLEDDKMLIGFPVDIKCFKEPLSFVTTRQSPVGSFEAATQTHNMTFKADDEKRIRQLKMVNAELFPEFLSLEAFCTDLAIRGSYFDNLNGIKLRSSMGNRYTHIIPIYLSQQHYERSETYLKTLISVICFGSDGSKSSDFHPGMFVKVYPALMNKQIVSLLRCQAYDSEMLLIAFANLLRTYRYACSRYPEVQEINDKHVMEFCKEEKYRTKEWTNDLGELLFKMAAVDRSKNPECSFENLTTKKVFIEEFFARRIFWADRYWKQKGDYNFFNKFYDASMKLSAAGNFQSAELQNECIDLLNKFFMASEVSFKVLLFNLECLRTFVTPDFDELLDSNFGLLDKGRIQAFRKSMEEIKQLSKLSEFFQRSNCPIYSLQAVFYLIMQAYTDAKRFGYFS
uniref:UBC core domain-containing protein n=1 Tax=Panagrolaimus davidi TaxID=227884 RepID=A0A914QSE6_9BILA